MKNIIEKSFNINVSVMKFLCMYSTGKPTFIYKMQAYILYFICIILLPTLTLLNFVLAEEVDISKANYNAAFVAEAIGFVMKVLPFIRRAEEMKTCINYFSDPFFSEVENEKQEKIIVNCVRICRRNSTVFVTGLILGVFSWILRPLTKGDSSLPLDIWLPFYSTIDERIHYFLYSFVSVAIVGTAFLGTIADPLIGGLAYHAACQLQVLKDNLQNLKEYASMNNSSNNDFVNQNIYNKIQRCLYHHRAILKFVDLYENSFSLVVFSQFAGSAFAMCFCILQLTVMEIYSVNGLNAIACIWVAMVQIYFYCYYGTILTEEHSSLKDAIYMGKWYEYDMKARKSLIIMMEYSKKPIVITAGKILDLSLETFTTMLKRTYSLLAVLKNYQ